MFVSGNVVIILRRVTFVLLLAVAVACNAGKPAPFPYACGDVTRGHCYTYATIGQRITGFRTIVTISGSLAPGNGFVTNEFWLKNYSGAVGWIELGYISNGVEPLHYFYAIVNPATGIFRQTTISTIPREDIEGRVTLDVHQIAPNEFEISVNGPATQFSTTENVSLWSGSEGGYVDVGMELAGTTGAYASITMFVKNQVYDTRHRRRFAAGSDGYGVTTHNPPYGEWLQSPAASPTASPAASPVAGPEGGTFITYCCAPP